MLTGFDGGYPKREPKAASFLPSHQGRAANKSIPRTMPYRKKKKKETWKENK